MPHEEGIGTLSLARHMMTKKPLIFSCDSSNKSTRHEIKVVSFWCIDCVLVLLLDSDATLGGNVNAASISLKNIDHCDGNGPVEVRMSGLCNNVRGW